MSSEESPGERSEGLPRGGGGELRARSLAWCAEELGDQRGKSCLAGQGPARASRLEAGDFKFWLKIKKKKNHTAEQLSLRMKTL